MMFDWSWFAWFIGVLSGWFILLIFAAVYMAGKQAAGKTQEHPEAESEGSNDVV